MNFITNLIGIIFCFFVLTNWIVFGFDNQLIKWFLVGLGFLFINNKESGK